MKHIPKAELQAYLSDQIEQGRYVEIAAPEPRGTESWVLMDRQHSSERARAQDLSIVVPKSPYVVSALKPTNGVIASLAVEPPQPSLLDENISPTNSAAPLEIARRTTMSIQSMKVTDHRVAMALNTDSSIPYETLVQLAGSEEELNDSLKRLKRFKTQGMNVQTIDQMVAIEPEKILTKSVPMGKTELVTLTYLGLEPAVRGDVMLMLQIRTVSVTDSVSVTGIDGRQRTRLNTLNNQRTLKLLQAAQLMDLNVQAEMSREYDLWTRKWVFVLIAVTNEVNLLARMGPVGTFVNENF